jgi:hypothetical protein
MNELGILARTYLDYQQVRVGARHRRRRFAELEKDVEKAFKELERQIKQDEKQTLTTALKIFQSHPIWAWCKRIKGFGPVAALTFLGYIDPYAGKNPEDCKQVSAGQVKKYFGVTPDSKLVSGKKGGFNPEAKGRLWFLVRNLILYKDPYYFELYRAKKQYYLNKMGSYINDPTKCPRYTECLQKLARAAAREKREVKKPPCRKHIDDMARRWLAGIILSHALEIIRDSMGLDISNLRQHRNYIPPKAFQDQVPSQDIIAGILNPPA